MKSLCVLIIGLLCVGLASCEIRRSTPTITPDTKSAFLSDFPEELHDDFLPALTMGPQDEVLHYMNAGLKAFAYQKWSAAEIAFDRILSKIETPIAENKSAQRARTLFIQENYKDFIGEPYERMMAYYYRGLLYLRISDYENARASFRSGLLQDSLALNKKYKQDSALLAYLTGWASHCMQDFTTAQDSFAEAERLSNGTLTPPPKDHTILLVAEAGSGPMKRTRGLHNQRMAITKNHSLSDRKVIFKSKNKSFETNMAENVLYQARTRGPRQVDPLLEAQAQLKNQTSMTGHTLIGAGASALHAPDENAGIVGGVMMLAGAIVKGVSMAVNPQADIRMWDNLPQRIYLTSITNKDILFDEPLRVIFQTKSGLPLKHLERTTFYHGLGKCKFAWAASRTIQ